MIREEVATAIIVLTAMREDAEEQVFEPTGNIARPHHRAEWRRTLGLAWAYTEVIEDLIATHDSLLDGLDEEE